MHDICSTGATARVNATNCAQMLLGKKRYRQMMEREAFLLLPEWAQRWEKVFKEELGLSTPALARQVIGENRRELIYMDTGLFDIPYKSLQECARFTGLELSIEEVMLDNLLFLLAEAEKKARECVK
jgi:hypothetical protein